MTAAKKQQTAEQKLAKRYIAKVSDYNKTFTSPTGKLVMDDMFKAHGMLNSTFNANSLESAYQEGQRSVILRILKITGTKPAKLKQMITRMENNDV